MSDIRYAKSRDVHIGNAVTGERPLDLILVPAWASNIELYSEDPRAARLNDRLGGSPTLEERMDDVRAVMNAVGSQRAALLGFWEGGPMSALFAATHPERVAALVLYGMMASYTWSPDRPWAPTADANETATSTVEATWGRGVAVDRLAPSLSGDDAFRQWWARLERNSLSPGSAPQMFRLNTAIEVRAVLGSIQAPTLVLHRRDDAMVPIEAGRYVARSRALASWSCRVPTTSRSLGTRTRSPARSKRS